MIAAYTGTPTCSRQSFFCASYSNIVTHAMFLPNLINKVAIDTKRIRFDYKMHNQTAVKEKNNFDYHLPVGSLISDLMQSKRWEK